MSSHSRNQEPKREKLSCPPFVIIGNRAIDDSGKTTSYVTALYLFNSTDGLKIEIDPSAVDLILNVTEGDREKFSVELNNLVVKTTKEQLDSVRNGRYGAARMLVEEDHQENTWQKFQDELVRVDFPKDHYVKCMGSIGSGSYIKEKIDFNVKVVLLEGRV